MIFDINQKEFPSYKHKNVWEKAVKITPFESCLGEDYLNSGNAELMESCRQFREYFLYLYEDIYNNMNEYDINIDPRMMYFADFYREIGLLGEAADDMFILNEKGAKRVKKMKEQELRAWERQGLQVGNIANMQVILKNKKFPEMFPAVKAMAEAAKNQSTQGKFNFYDCEFRQLFKNFTPGYDDRLLKMNDSSKKVLETFDAYAKERKLQRNSSWNIKYRYRSCLVFQMVGGERIDIYTAAGKSTDGDKVLFDAFHRILGAENDETKEFYIKHIHKCSGCNPNCPTIGSKVNLLGTNYNPCCSVVININDENKDKFDIIKRLIDIRVKILNDLSDK